ncbi:hypothetical protein FOA52_011537 [Chlamydomonas sp. UWO 241]|nr:hypothetical protein FOA52_011537 [Chlamydomonas sp. UWO 241]
MTATRVALTPDTTSANVRTLNSHFCGRRQLRLLLGVRPLAKDKLEDGKDDAHGSEEGDELGEGAG